MAPLAPAEFDRRLDAYLGTVTRRRRRLALPPPQVRVVAESRGIDYRFGSERAFHAASVGKMFTATAVLRLVAAGRVELDAPLCRVLPESDWGGLVIADGTDLGGEVTLAQLLTHTGGMPDYFDGPTRAGRSFAAQVAAERDQFWEPAELLDYSKRFQSAAGRPGERFAYSDTGYVLLGRVAEEVTGESWGRVLHGLVLDPAGMADSCLHLRTVPGGGIDESGSVPDIEPLWLGRTELSGARSVSCDWAGGGVATTTDDLVRFQRALHGGDLLEPQWVEWMARPRHRFRAGIHVGAGTMTLRFGEFAPLLRGLGRPVGHLGVLGTHMFFAPESSAHVVLNFHATREMVRSVRCHIRIAQLVAKVAH